MSKPNNDLKSKIDTYLSGMDHVKFMAVCKQKRKTKSELAREAIRWYLEHHEQIAEQSHETEVAQAMRYTADQTVKAINGGVDRICKMLARQGRAIGTLYELSWMSLPDEESARNAFQAALTKAKQRMARHVEKDELELAERMKKVVNS